MRFDRRFLLQHTNIIFYLSVWNAYNRKNVAQYFWNATENAPDAISQWTLLPIFGLKLSSEFIEKYCRDERPFALLQSTFAVDLPKKP
ncbi:MAG: hypothetical protein R3C26_04680 [Calditrichia bacterium]